MSEPTTVTYSIAEVLKRIEDKLDSNQKETNEKFKEVNQKLETIEKDLTDVKVSIATVTEKVASMDKRLEKVEGTQKNQVWTLIILLAGALQPHSQSETATAAARLFFTGNP